MKFEWKKGVKIAEMPSIKIANIENILKATEFQPFYNCSIEMKFRLRLSHICSVDSFLHFPLKPKVGKTS